MAQVKNPYPLCQHDGFPMVKIKGRLHCAAEYLDRCIGQQDVIEVIQRNQTTYYVFENGHQLPLLCFCCARPLVTEELLQFRLEFSGKGWFVFENAVCPRPQRLP